MQVKTKLITAGSIVLLSAIFLVFHLVYFRAPEREAGVERFVIAVSQNEFSIVAGRLKKEGFIRSITALNIARRLYGGSIEPGGYKLSKSMNAWEIARTISERPYMRWVTFPEGIRKEQMALILAEEFSWSDEDVKKWITEDTVQAPDYIEGVYFPDTYLISEEEDPQTIARRLRNKFEEKFQEFSKLAEDKNIRWTTLLKIASIVEREASGKTDMPLIAGIIWNRLENDMRLEVDATLQYARDSILFESNFEKDFVWWKPLSSDDRQLDSPFNTYKRKGLPPHPISNPGVSSIEASLNPRKTDCLFYLHDADKITHCSLTFDEHKRNIEKYLR